MSKRALHGVMQRPSRRRGDNGGRSVQVWWAVNKAGIVLAVLRQTVVTQNFLLRAGLLVRMQAAWRRERFIHLRRGKGGKAQQRCRDKQR